MKIEWLYDIHTMLFDNKLLKKISTYLGKIVKSNTWDDFSIKSDLDRVSVCLSEHNIYSAVSARNDQQQQVARKKKILACNKLRLIGNRFSFSRMYSCKYEFFGKWK